MYFKGFQGALDPIEANRLTVVAVPDTGGDILPFGHLEDRRFEILVYRLKCVELAGAGSRVTLMQGVGERGRDVIVYSSSGKLTQIVQCKKHGDRLTAPSLRSELLKLALHNYLDPAILDGGPVQYELWCPGGLTEPASKLLDTWPKGWTASALSENAAEVIEAYAAFQGLDWKSVGESVVKAFEKAVQPRWLSGVDISLRVKDCIPIYEAFFQGKVVMDRGDVLEAVRAAVAEASGFARLTDKDAKHVLDRIAEFAPERRLVHTSGYVMGLPPELVGRFNQKEFESFVNHAMQATMGIIGTSLEACARLVGETTREFRESVQPQSKSITLVFAQTLNLSMIARVSRMLMRGLNLQPGLDEYDKLNLRQRLEHHAREIWDQYQRCLAGYDPSKHRFGSDEEFRARLAMHGMDGAGDREEFERRLLAAVDQHAEALQAYFEGFMSLVPTEILVITDSVTVFENRWLLERMADSVRLIERLRGSAAIPE